jgi:hypothetical protein
MDTINQSFPIVVDKPANDLHVTTHILSVVFLGAPMRKEREIVMHRTGKMAMVGLDVWLK